jgi:outer membrane protein assembly factor BamB
MKRGKRIVGLYRILLGALLFTGQFAQAQDLDATLVWQAQGTGNRSGFSSPVIADIDGDLSNGKEIVAASINGTLSAFGADGVLRWEVTMPAAKCTSGNSNIHSSPSVGAIYGDGKPYVVIGYGNIKKRCEGGVMAIDGATGAEAWRFSTMNYAKKEKFFAFLHTVFSSPALADTDGDGKMEIGFGSFDRSVYLLNHDGSVRWYYQAADTVWSTPTFANVDTTPELEMIVATDITQNLRLKPATSNGGNLYAFRTKANPKKVYRFRDKKAFLWMRPMEQVLFSSPKVADIIPGNPGLEIAINSGCFFPERTTQKVGRWTRVISAKSGKILRTHKIEACSSSSPVLADVNNDGAADIFVTVNGAKQIGGDGLSRLRAFDGATGAELWNIVPKFNNKNYSFGGNFISPKITSVLNDSTLQVVVPVHAGIGIYDAQTGEERNTCSDTEGCVLGSSLKAADIFLNSAAVDDIDGDSIMDIVASGKSTQGKLGVYRWNVVTPTTVE